MYRGWTQTDYQNKHYNRNQMWIQLVQRTETNRLPKQAIEFELNWLQYVLCLVENRLPNQVLQFKLKWMQHV